MLYSSNLKQKKERRQSFHRCQDFIQLKKKYFEESWKQTQQV